MTTRDAPADPKDLPTESSPAVGAAGMAIGGKRIELSHGAWWIDPESGDTLIQSSEFDVWAAGPSFEDALEKFIDALWEYAGYLGNIEDRAPNEEKMFHLLAPRLISVSHELERCLEVEKQRRISINLSRRRRSSHDWREWRPSSRQHGSLMPSPV